MRESGLQLGDYPNYIAPYNIDKLSRRHHPLGNFPVYPKNGEPGIFYEEKLASERYKDLVDTWSRAFNRDKATLVRPGMEIMMTLGQHSMAMIQNEFRHHRALEKLAEETIREYFNMSKDEVLFDVEILNPTTGEKPADSFDFNKGEKETTIDDPAFKEDLRDELIRRRITNALIQGSALKGHYLFHIAHDRLEALSSGITRIYNRAMVLNDLLYWYNDDVRFGQETENDNEAGMMELDFSGEVPVVRVKAMCFTVLMHEMVKGVTELLFTQGLPKDPHKAKQVIDLCDTVLNEFWDIRLGPKLWEMLYNLIDVEDHDVLKHVVVGLAQLNTEDFLKFISDMFAEKPEAKRVVDGIIKRKRAQVLEYMLDSSSRVDDDDELPNVDWDSLMS